MRSLFIFTGLVMVAMLFWSTLACLMALPSLRISLVLTTISILLFLGTGLLKNLAEKRKFEAFLENLKRDKDLQEKLKNEKIDPGDKTGRAKIKAYYRERNIGVTWTGASVHGAVPKRNKRRDFLPGNR
jgi:hypothetical protein